MTLTLSWPLIAIILFVLVTQIWAWTRDNTTSFIACSDRGFAVLLATILDVLFIFLVGGIWLW